LPSHTTSTMEFQEAGIRLKTEGEHVVRVMGACKEVGCGAVAITWEDRTRDVDGDMYDRYYAGALSSPQEDPDAQPYHPSVTAVVFTRGEGAVFLERDWS
jgi:hypothetical protein